MSLLQRVVVLVVVLSIACAHVHVTCVGAVSLTEMKEEAEAAAAAAASTSAAGGKNGDLERLEALQNMLTQDHGDFLKTGSKLEKSLTHGDDERERAGRALGEDDGSPGTRHRHRAFSLGPGDTSHLGRLLEVHNVRPEGTVNILPHPQEIAYDVSKRLVLPSVEGIKVAIHTPRGSRDNDVLLKGAITRMKKGLVSLGVAGGRGGDVSLEVWCTQEPHVPLPYLGVDESYSLAVDPNDHTIIIRAPTMVGVLYAAQTLLQMVQIPDTKTGSLWLPQAMIHDAPRFPWRGLMIDSSRHFHPLESLMNEVDAMEASKLNVLHLHLMDDQGFRVESKLFPLLHEVGGEGEYYSQDDLKRLIEYAGARGVRVIPEFDMPGHATALLFAYPEHGVGKKPSGIERRWGVFKPTLDVTKESVYDFLKSFFQEMATIFKDDYFHIGGDEVSRESDWRRSSETSQFMTAHGMHGDYEQLQAHFNGRVLDIFTDLSKKMVGWDEVFVPGIRQDVVIQSWRGAKSLAHAADQGYQGILSSGYYLDHVYPAAKHYAKDPLDHHPHTEGNEKYVLGGEACMWAEYVSGENLPSRVWPRMAGLAERFWSITDHMAPSDNELYRRLDAFSHFLVLSHTMSAHVNNFFEMVTTLAVGHPSTIVNAVLHLGMALEPSNRVQTESYTQLRSLNELVDCLPPESVYARHFAAEVNTILVDSADHPDAEERVRGCLLEWKQQHDTLQAVNMFDHSEALHGYEDLSESVATVAEMGLQCLDGKLEGGISRVRSLVRKLRPERTPHFPLVAQIFCDAVLHLVEKRQCGV